MIKKSCCVVFIVASIFLNDSARGEIPDQVYSPYVDICSTPTFTIGSMCDETNSLYYTLAFVVPGFTAETVATWGGTYPVSSSWYLDQVEYIRSKGGDVVVSFGGAAERELARTITNVEDLKVQYQSVIDRYELTQIDFDIEGGALTDTDANTRRNQAIKLLQDDNPGLRVGYCFPVTPDYGVTPAGISILSDAITNSARVDLVVCMAMNYGPWYDSQPEYQDQGTNAILCIQHTYNQLKVLYPTKTDNEIKGMLGVAQMIGVNDNVAEVFSLDDATQLLGFTQDSDIQMLSIWSVNRDNGSCPGHSSSALATCSGLEQDLYEFSNIFKVFSGDSNPEWSDDYNGDGTSDIAIFRDFSGLWAIRGVTRTYFGSSSDIPVPGDYNGNNTTDFGVYRSSSGMWAIKGITREYFGSSLDTVVPGDYNGDGTCDMGIFRNSSGLWAIKGITRLYFGGATDSPAPGYYSSDSSKKIGIYRSSTGLWAIKGISRIYFGSTGDEIVPGDYNGDGVWDYGVFRSSSGLWAIRGITRSYFGSSSDAPVPADYTGNGRDDICIFRETLGLWAIHGISRVYFGSTGDIPVTR